MSTDTIASLGRAIWPQAPAAPDPTGASFLVVAAGSDPAVAEVARDWVAAAQAIAPTVLVSVGSMTDPDARGALEQAMAAARTGVRILVAGGQYDVMVVTAIAYAAGAETPELTAFVTHTRDLPLYCVHCRDTFRVAGGPGSIVECPGCAMDLEIHAHHSVVLGSFLGSASDAGTLP